MRCPVLADHSMHLLRINVWCAGLRPQDLLTAAQRSGNPACLDLCTGWTAGQLRRAQAGLAASFPDLPLDPAAPGVLRSRRCWACVEVSSRMAAMTQGTPVGCSCRMLRLDPGDQSGPSASSVSWCPVDCAWERLHRAARQPLIPQALALRCVHRHMLSMPAATRS